MTRSLNTLASVFFLLPSTRDLKQKNQNRIIENRKIHVKAKSFNLDNTPALFNKKSKKLTCKPLIYIKSDTGGTRHFTPAAQEWFNSIYSYNHNYIKTLPSADKSLISLLESYFNSILKPKFLASKRRDTKAFKTSGLSLEQIKIKKAKLRKLRKLRHNKKVGLRKIKYLPIRIRRRSTKRVFVGRGELKHTNKKVVLTFYLYSTQEMVLSHTYKALTQGLFQPLKMLKKTITWVVVGRKKKKVITYNRIFTLYEFLALQEHYYWYLSFITSIINKLNKRLSLINSYVEDLNDLVEINVITESEKKDMFFNKIKGFAVTTYPDYSLYLSIVQHYYKKDWFRYMYLLNTYRLRFTKAYLHKLNILVNNLYNKKVVFNIVNLKKMHLNSDIFTQAVSLKLRNKKNKLYRTLKASLRKVSIKPFSKIRERRLAVLYKKVSLVNKIRNNIITSMFISDNGNYTLSNLLCDFFYTPAKMKKGSLVDLLSRKYIIRGLGQYVKTKLKHMVLRGIRVEAKGRITRRTGASRSVFKMRLKGGLKNVDSSFRGWSVIMLRGIAKSNVQYSVKNSNNPSGAYGVKGWVSNK